jgi:hypothetical protein
VFIKPKPKPKPKSEKAKSAWLNSIFI